MTERDQGAELHALVEIMYLVAAADGEFSFDERRFFLDMVSSLSEGRIDSTELLGIVERARAHLESRGLTRRLEELHEILADETSRRLAYGLGMQVALVGAEVGDAEKRVLDEIANVFALSGDESDEIASSVRYSSHRQGG